MAFVIYCHVFLQELFSKQKGFLEEELDYRKQALDQAYMVRSLEQYDLHLYTTVSLLNGQNLFCHFGICNIYILFATLMRLCTRQNGSGMQR